MGKNFLVQLVSVLFDGMLLMFAFPFVGMAHMGYWACVLIGYAVQAVISTGVYNGTKVAIAASVAEIGEAKASK